MDRIKDLTQTIKNMNDQMADMQQQANKLLDDVRRMRQAFTWSSWEPHTVGVIPRHINGRWYFKGDTVYRREKMRYLTGSKEFQYGDEFDILGEVE